MYPEFPDLGPWVKRQRLARQQGSLTPERLNILHELGFEFGEEAQMTEEWEWRFDSLVELLLMRVCHDAHLLYIFSASVPLLHVGAT
jgi:hypothetical protein